MATYTLQGLIQIAEEIVSPQQAETALEGLLDNDGAAAATAVVEKLWTQAGVMAPTEYPSGTPAVLAQGAFLEFRHYLRTGNGIYPGAPDIPPIEAGADIIYDEGTCRSTIHAWCNAAVTAFYATWTAPAIVNSTPPNLPAGSSPTSGM